LKSEESSIKVLAGDDLMNMLQEKIKESTKETAWLTETMVAPFSLYNKPTK